MRLNLGAVNSATKYPSIPTYHILGERGMLTEEATAFEGDVVFTEKVDGTNGRIVLLPDGDWLIGSREELLTARGDRVANPSQSIAATLSPLAEKLTVVDTDYATVFFLEVYGHKIGAAAKQYTTTGSTGYRLFDVAFVPLHVLDWHREQIANWRDSTGPRWATESTLHRISESENVQLVPRLGTMDGSKLPTDIGGMNAWLGSMLPRTFVSLDEEETNGKAEGIVLRSADRSVIAKARFEDYERTLRRRK
jgi:hypothetical protein